MSLAARVAVRRETFALDVDLGVPDGGVVAVLGPNGAGKTTLLRALAGLSSVDEGRVEAGGTVWEDTASGRWLPPERRGVGLVFSDHLLFGHLTALQNVAFGPRARGVQREEARRRAQTWLDKLGIGDLAARRPSALSGGQAQRVALARALATEPAVLLLDEPLAALDASTRVEVRRALADVLGERRTVCLLVTHDPVDATLLADRVVVLEAGAVVQDGTPAELARAPRTGWTARLLGLNVYRGVADGTAVALDDGGRLVPAEAPVGAVVVTVAPGAIALHAEQPHGSPRNVWRTHVTTVEQAGSVVRVGLAGPPAALADLTSGAAAELGLAPGVEVWASVKANEVHAEPD